MDTIQNNQSFSDKDILTDVLSSQKFITDGYNNFANECATPEVRSSFVNILTDEHQIQSDIFCEMQKRGWYQVEAAEQTKINQAKQKYQSMTNPLMNQ